MKLITTLVLLIGVAVPAWARHSLLRTGASRHSHPIVHHPNAHRVVRTPNSGRNGTGKRVRLVRSHVDVRSERTHVHPLIIRLERPRRRHAAAYYYPVAYNSGLMFGIPQSISAPWPVWSQATIHMYSTTFGKTQPAVGPIISNASYTTTPIRVQPTAMESESIDSDRTEARHIRARKAKVKKEVAAEEADKSETQLADADQVETDRVLTGHKADRESDQDGLVRDKETADNRHADLAMADSDSADGPEAKYIGRVEEKRPRVQLSLRSPSVPVQIPVETPDRTDDVADLVTIVFKDGRPPERIRNYMVSRSTLSIVGKHMRDIPIEDLDMVATAKVNQEAGVEFRLPDEQR